MVERAIRVTENNAGSSADEFASRSFPIGEDMALQKREWLLERAAWIGTALVLLLAQQALLGDDYSLTTAMLVIATLIVLDIGFSLLKTYITVIPLEPPQPSGRAE